MIWEAERKERSFFSNTAIHGFQNSTENHPFCCCTVTSGSYLEILKCSIGSLRTAHTCDPS